MGAVVERQSSAAPRAALEIRDPRTVVARTLTTVAPGPERPSCARGPRRHRDLVQPPARRAGARRDPCDSLAQHVDDLRDPIDEFALFMSAPT